MIPSNQLHNHSDTAALSHDSLNSWIYSLFSSSSDAIIACDLNGAICAWNQGAQQIFGIHPKQSLGRDLNRLFLGSISRNTTTAAVTVTAASAPTPVLASIPSDSDLYPSTLEQIRSLKGSSIKRVVSRIVKDQTQHQFLESISAIYEQQTAAVAERNGSSNGSINSQTESNGRHSHAKDDLAASTPVLVGYSVILTDLSSLSTFPVSPKSHPQPTLPPSATISPSPPLVSSSSALDEAQTVPAIIESTAPSPLISPPFSEPSGTATFYQSLVSEEHDQGDASFNFPDIASRPTASREYSTDSGFDERSPASKPAAITVGPSTASFSNGESTVHVPALDLSSQDPGLSISNSSSEPVIMSTAPLLLDLIPGYNSPISTTPLPTSCSNGVCFPDSSQERGSLGRPAMRATSMGHLLSLPSLDAMGANRPRALSIAATAISYTSSGTQLSVSMSSSPDQSRLDIHHNPLSLSNAAHHPISLSPVVPRQERGRDEAYFTYLAPIAANLLSCHGDSFFDVVVEELAIHLGVKYAFISQLVSLDELKELEPTEYINLIQQFDGVVPQIDGVMHNISSWPGDSHINPHAFQGYLADCTIQDKITFLEANLADSHQDVAECLMDQTIQSYIGARLETSQGEIVGVIGIIHDKPLTQEDGEIVKAVLSHVGASVANELDRLRVEANLISARDVAESIAKNKTKFLADMSHEIRNPMNAVVGVTHILLDTVGLSEEQTGYIEVIRTSGQHLLTVINDILDISRIDQDVKFLLERRPLSLRKCLKDAVNLAGLTPQHDVSRSISVIEWPPEMDDLGPFSELEETNILPLLWSIDPDVPEHLLGDITRLRQVLINLCTNSLKFTQRGRVSVHVSIHRPTAQYPTIQPNNSPMVTVNLPQGSQAHSSREGDGLSLPSSPMLGGSDHRTQMVFQQRYDVRADGNNGGHVKSSFAAAASTRRRPGDKRHWPTIASFATGSDQAGSTPTPPSLTVVAPTANSLKGNKLDDNMVVLEFAVSDTGVGIPGNKITELFTSFSQVDTSVSTRFGGTGLGLAISASLVEKMGGNIWVESTEGVGSRFTFTIPFTICQPSETESHPSVTAPSSPVFSPVRHETAGRGSRDSFMLPMPIDAPPIDAPSDPKRAKPTEAIEDKTDKNVDGRMVKTTLPPIPADTSKPLTPTYAKVVESSLKPLTINGVPLRILLAEDNSVNQKIAVGVLKKLGYENVDVAENGLEVIDKLDKGSVYDVILMDVSMPVMDGIDATKTIVERRKRGLLMVAEDLSAPDTNVGQDGEAFAATSTYKDYLNLYIIALTASAMGSDKERCMDAGMDDFMTKPFVLLEMKRVLSEFITKWNDGVLQTRNENCLVAALASRSRCNSPNCPGGSLPSKEHGRSLTPTPGNPLNANSSNVNLTDLNSEECQSCGGAMSSSGDINTIEGGLGPSASSPNSSQNRTCRMETPRPQRRNLENIGCGLFSAGRRSNSEAAAIGHSNSALGGPLGAAALEGANLSRRSSDASSFSKREWRSGIYDVHPLDTSNGSGITPDHDRSNSNGPSSIQPTHLRVKRVMSPSNLSKEQDLSSFRPMASPLSPLSLLTTDTEGSYSVSPPLSSSSTSSPTTGKAESEEEKEEEEKEEVEKGKGKEKEKERPSAEA